MKRAILTGFEPFGPYEYNPVKDTAIEYHDTVIGDVEICGLVLPCTYHGAFDILSEKISQLSPDVILSTGLSSRVEKIRLEAIGKNIMNGKYADADGRKPDGEPIIPGGAEVYRTNANNGLLAILLYRSGISAEVSFDAEGFICNSLLYLTAGRIREENLPIRHAFFHTPWTDDYLDRVHLEEGKVAIKKEDLRRAIEITIWHLGKCVKKD